MLLGMQIRVVVVAFFFFGIKIKMFQLSISIKIWGKVLSIWGNYLFTYKEIL